MFADHLLGLFNLRLSQWPYFLVRQLALKEDSSIAALALAARARAGADGCSALELEVFAQNPWAVRLYQKHGFVVCQA